MGTSHGLLGRSVLARRTAVLLLVALAAIPATAPAAAEQPDDSAPAADTVSKLTVLSASSAFVTGESSALRNLAPWPAAFVYMPQTDFSLGGEGLRAIAALTIDSGEPGKMLKGKGKVTAIWTCRFAEGGSQELGRQTVKVQAYGSAYASAPLMPQVGDRWCDQIGVTFKPQGSMKVPSGSTVSTRFFGSPAASAGECVAHATTMCLQGGRFEVNVEWSDFAGKQGHGIFVDKQADSWGTFYFFSQENYEMVVKVLDRCDVSDHFWVFAAAPTDIAYTLSVTDTRSGQMREYTNELGTPAPAITDTRAFATCSQ